MSTDVSAASVYKKLFSVGRTEPDPFKKHKTKIRKGKHLKKEIQKQRKARKQARIFNSRLKNSTILAESLRTRYPGIKNVEENAKNVRVVIDDTDRTVRKEKLQKIADKLILEDKVFNAMVPKTLKRFQRKQRAIAKVKLLKEAERMPKEKKTELDESSVTKTAKKKAVNKSDENLINRKAKKTVNKLNENSATNGLVHAAPKHNTTKGNSKKGTVLVNSTAKTSGIGSNSNPMAVTSNDFEGKEKLEWILGCSSEQFMRDHWEKSPLYVARKNEMYYEGLVTCSLLHQILNDNCIEFVKNIDITHYENGIRTTCDLEGRAVPHIVWSYFQNKHSVRFLNPQSYIKPLQALNAELQEFFGCFVGANTYLTPPYSQGFAPHYDDIEAFILQTEGKKHWRVYAPRNPNEQLPRYSSPNFKDNEIGKPILEVILEPGDLLYIPRGFIHQAKTVEHHHSLHVTISVYQKTAWADLLEKILPKALEKAATNCIDYRKGLPVGYLQHAGLSRHKNENIMRTQMKENLKGLLCKLVDYADLDEGVDAMGKQFMHVALPPVFREDELERTVFGNGIKMNEKSCLENAGVELDCSEDEKVRPVQANIARLIKEVNDEGVPELRLYFTLENSLEYEGKEPQFLVIPESSSSNVLELYKAYPNFCTLQDLVTDIKANKGKLYDMDRLCVIRDLWEHGLLMTSEPLKNMVS